MEVRNFAIHRDVEPLYWYPGMSVPTLRGCMQAQIYHVEVSSVRLW